MEFKFIAKLKPNGDFYWINLLAICSELGYSPDLSINMLSVLIKTYSNKTDNWVYLTQHEVIDESWFDGELYKNIITVLKTHNQLDKFLLIDTDLKYYHSFKNTLPYYKSIPLMIGENHQYISMSYDDIFSLKPNPFIKKFMCLNGVDRNYRKLIYDFIHEKNIVDNTFLSFTPTELDNQRHTTIGDNWDFPFNNDNIHKKFNYRNRKHISNVYNLSFCNIITETQFNTTIEKSMQITEKTDKSFTTLQPFVLVSTTYSIKRLHEYGFKTFDKWWDESYDLEEDNSVRMQKLFNVIEYINSFSLEELTEIYNDMKPILIHNFELSLNMWNNQNSHWYPNPKFDLITFKKSNSFFYLK